MTNNPEPEYDADFGAIGSLRVTGSGLAPAQDLASQAPARQRADSSATSEADDDANSSEIKRPKVITISLPDATYRDRIDEIAALVGETEGEDIPTATMAARLLVAAIHAWDQGVIILGQRKVEQVEYDIMVDPDLRPGKEKA